MDSPKTIEKKTFCRLCEVNCGLEVSVSEDGKLLGVKPDKAHPVTAGFACHKGLLAKDVHFDPDRAMTPQRRTEHGFVQADWADATSDIAARLSAIIEEHGPGSVALYLGNPPAFNALGAMSTGMFAAAIGSEHLFNAGTQDCANKFAIGELLYGSAELHPIADLDGCDFLLMIGTNPRVSKLSFLSTADPVAALREVRDRGAKTVFVNPLQITDLEDVGETLQIRPDSDTYLLAAMLGEIERNPRLGFDEAALVNVENVDRLRSFVKDYSPESVAEIVGISADEIRQLAIEFAQAKGAAIHLSTGVNMGRQGALAYWLAQMISLVTGNLGRLGGNFFASRGLNPMELPPEASATRESEWGEYRPPRGSPPGALMANMILDSESPIRALIVVAGNPALTIGGGPRLAEALDQLDLVVCLDFYRNATGEHADWVLPATDWFEREDLNYFVQGVQRKPYLQWTDAMVEPRGERRPEWWALSRILQEMGRPSLLDLPDDDIMKILWDGRLGENGHSLAALREAPGGIQMIDRATDAASLQGPLAKGPFDCCPDALLGTLARAKPIFDEFSAEAEGQLKLITRRTQYMLNSGMQNLKALKTAKGSLSNPLYMNPKDALQRGLRDRQRVRVHNQYGEVETEIELEPKLRIGVVAMSHGFGNAKTTGMPVAQSYPGVNVNALSPVGTGSFDPVSSMSHLTGISVEVTAA